MKIKALIVSLVAFTFSAALLQAAPKGELSVKAGDTAYVCGCGEKCSCEVASIKAGKCGCGHELTKVTVSKVKGKKATYEADGKEHTFKTAGKYACACGGDCCQMISQKPGKCQCGKELAQVEKPKK